VPLSREDALHRVRAQGDRLIEAVLEARPELDGYFASEGIVDLIAQEYEGRAVAELIQNAHDQLDGTGRVHVLLVTESDGIVVLYVANDGRPFADENLEAILRIARSSKAPGASIGYKGVGFKAVLPLSASPEIYSGGSIETGSFDGYRFRFGRPDDVVSRIGDAKSAIFLSRLPAASYPVPLDEDGSPNVGRFAAEGFASVVRIPLDEPGAVERVTQELDELEKGSAPPQLFLTRLTSLTLERPGHEPPETAFRRTPKPLDLGDNRLSALELDLGSLGSYVVVKFKVDPEALKSRVDESVRNKQIDKRWKDALGSTEPPTVDIAIRTDGDCGRGRLYAFLPMSSEEPSPFAGHLNAPFATRLARDRVRFEIPVNWLLMDEAARAAVAAAEAIRDAKAPWSRRVTADLVSWIGAHAPRLRRALEESGRPALVPVVSQAGRSWTPLDCLVTWPHEGALWLRSERLTLLSSAQLADPEVGDERVDRLRAAANATYDRETSAPPDVVATWAVEIAASLQARRTFSAPDWLAFYDDLALVFAGNAEALEGRKLLLTESGELATCGRKGQLLAARSGPVVFFPPTVSDGAEDFNEGVNTVGRVPAALSRRIAFMHPAFGWTPVNAETRSRPMRPSREFFAAKQLVRPYETQDVLLLVRDEMGVTQNKRRYADALRFVFAQTRSHGVPAEPPLASLGLKVPTKRGSKNGAWIPAHDATFGPEWHGTNGSMLERLLDAWGESPSMDRLRQTMMAPPSDWPNFRLPVPTEAWVSFLRDLGVRDGLTPTSLLPEVRDSASVFLDHAEVARRVGLDDEVAGDWMKAARRRGGRPYYVTVTYALDGGVAVLPGQGEYRKRGPAAQLLYGRLLAASLGRWPDEWLSVAFRRPRGAPTTDSFLWPSPASAFLEQLAWLPVSNPRSLPGEARTEDVARPADGWLFEDAPGDQPPGFVPLISADVRRRILSDERLKARLVTLGMRTWTDDGNASARLALLMDSFSRFGVLDGLELGFRKAVERAWAALLRSSPPPISNQLPNAILAAVGNRLELIDPAAAGTGEVWVLATEQRLTETLLRTIERPILVADPADGPSLVQLLSGRWPDRVLPVASGDTSVLVSGLAVSPQAGAPRLLERTGSWLTEVVTLVLELKATQFNRQSGQTVRQATERLRRIRVLEAESFSLRVRGLSVPPPATFRTAVPADDPSVPTLVVLPNVLNTWEGLRTAVPALTELLRQPLVTSALRDVMVDLGRATGTEDLIQPTVAEYAFAFGESEQRVGKILADHRSSLEELVDALRPVVAVLAGVPEALALAPAGTDRESVAAALRQIPAIAARADELVERAATVYDRAELRDILGISVLAFNRALMALGDPYRPITYDGEAWRALECWLRDNRVAVVDALRVGSMDEFRSIGDLSRYQRATDAVAIVATPARRDLRPIDGLGPDPAWAFTYDDPPGDVVSSRVEMWLAERSATLGGPSGLEERDALRARNADLLATLISSAALAVSAWVMSIAGVDRPDWARDEGRDLRSRLESEGWFDFELLTESWLLGWLASRGLWPEGMELSLDNAALGLTQAQLDLQRNEADRARAEQLRRRRSVEFDTYSISLEDGLDLVVDRVLSGILTHPNALKTKLRVSHLDTVRPSKKRDDELRDKNKDGGRGSGKGWDNQLSDDQKVLIGLIGEIATFEWLRAQLGAPKESWRSTNRTSRFRDDPGDDGAGFDFVVPFGKGEWYFEVKATTGSGTDVTTIELTSGEAKFARSQVRGRYNIILVTDVLDSSRRGLHLLPNPFAPEAVDLFRMRNRGFRFSFKF
jgi:hypothetical protein